MNKIILLKLIVDFGEIIIQNYIISDCLNNLFPFNILIIAGVVLVLAYTIHIIAEIVRQIMDSKPFDWGKIILHR